MSSKYGAIFSRNGNGISHFCHLERFDVPGQTMIGSDSHTRSAGALAMLAIGTGGAEVAAAMAGEPFYLACPKVVGVNLVGKLPPWVSAKDVILELLRRLTVKGGIGKVMEYVGPSLEHLTVYERETICTRRKNWVQPRACSPRMRWPIASLRAQKREQDWKPLAPDPGVRYDEEIESDNVSTDDILPGGNDVLPLRSNIPAISEYTFRYIDRTFPERARKAGGGFVVGGDNWGQGSSREHAAIAPMYLGVRAILARSYARIHEANLVNFGIVPLRFTDRRDSGSVQQGDELEMSDVRAAIAAGPVSRGAKHHQER